MRNLPFVLTGLLTALTLNAQAHDHGHSHGHDSKKTEHKHSHEDHDHGSSLGAHQHGVANLNLVIEGNAVAIELDSPADNLLGFEYTPRSEQDIAKVKDVMALLEQADTLFLFPAEADCTLEKVELEAAQFDAVKHADESHAKHKHSDHKHDHKHKDDHKHDGEHKHEHADAHADIEAHFHFQCSQPAALNQVEVALFEAFPGTEKLLLQAITPAGQQGGELSASQNVIRF